MYKLILADDEKIVLEGIENSIDWKAYGIELVGTASDGNELIALAEELKPDIIMTDIMMPQLNGLEAAMELRDRLKNTQFVFITAYAEFEYAKKAIDIGAVSFLTKPVLKRDLEEQIKRIVERLDEKRAYQDELDRIRQEVQKQKREDTPINAEAPIDRAITYINENIEHGVVLTDVAEYMNMNSSYFSRYFKEEYHMSFIDYVKAQKIKRAKELLVTTNMKIYEISDKLGYSSVQYFSLLFKNTVGMTPIDYKNSIEKNQTESNG